MAVDRELETLFFEETAANSGAALRALRPDRKGLPLDPETRAMLVRTFHILAGTAGLVGHADWGRLAAAAEVATRRWLEAGAIEPVKMALIRDTLAAVAAFAEGKSTPGPMILLDQWRQKGV